MGSGRRTPRFARAPILGLLVLGGCLSYSERDAFDWEPATRSSTPVVDMGAGPGPDPDAAAELTPVAEDPRRVGEAARVLSARVFDRPEPLVEGERAYGFERAGCRSDTSAWVQVYGGIYREVELENGDRSPALEVDARWRLSFHADAEGIDPETWWCEPKRRFCFGEIGFSDWNGPLKAGDVAPFHPAKLVSASYGLEAASLDAIATACAPSGTPE